jgi:hypothetical protein
VTLADVRHLPGSEFRILHASGRPQLVHKAWPIFRLSRRTSGIHAIALLLSLKHSCVGVSVPTTARKGGEAAASLSTVEVVVANQAVRLDPDQQRYGQVECQFNCGEVLNVQDGAWSLQRHQMTRMQS